MNLLIALFIVFLVPFSVMAADGTSAAQLIPVKEGDIVQYPINAEPLEVDAEINKLKYICTLMPGDSFEVIRIFNYDHYADKRSEIKLQKKGGTPGNQTICHEDSSIEIIGMHEPVKSKDGVPQIVNKIRSPFVNWNNIKEIQRRKRLPTTLATDETETILFKEDDLIVYPPEANPAEVESLINNIYFSCTEAPGDSFRVTGILNHTRNGYSIIIFRKEGGTPGNQDICPTESFTNIEITECVLQKTEEGMPEGLLCNHSLKTLFNPPEESSE